MIFGFRVVGYGFRTCGGSGPVEACASSRFDVGSARSFTSMTLDGTYCSEGACHIDIYLRKASPRATLVWSSDSSVTYDGWAVTYTGEQVACAGPVQHM